MQSSSLMQAGPQHTFRHLAQLQQGVDTPPPRCSSSPQCWQYVVAAGACVDVLRAFVPHAGAGVFHHCHQLSSSCNNPTVCTCRVNSLSQD